MNDYYREKDKTVSAYLLICKDIRFEGTSPVGEILYFNFSPKERAKKHAEQFISKQATLIQPKEYAEASQTITDLIWRWRHSRDGGNYGRNT